MDELEIQNYCLDLNPRQLAMVLYSDTNLSQDVVEDL